MNMVYQYRRLNIILSRILQGIRSRKYCISILLIRISIDLLVEKFQKL